jgi:CubicO group peptidase (beta-lactamase class C family)
VGEQMIRPTLISAATRTLLARPTALADGTMNPQNYALGWRSHEMKMLDGSATTRVLHHHGTALGAVSHFAVYPEEGVVVSLMMNLSQARFGPAADYLVDIFIKERNARRPS